MTSRKQLSKSVIMMTDTYLSYITLEKQHDGFSISQHEMLELPQGILKNGEILKADVLYKILKKISKDIKNKNIDILLPHDYFHFANDILDEPSQKKNTRKRVKEYFENIIHFFYTISFNISFQNYLKLLFVYFLFFYNLKKMKSNSLLTV